MRESDAAERRGDPVTAGPPPDRPDEHEDITDRRVRALVLAGVARAYGSEDPEPEEPLCNCFHYLTEHHGPDAHGRCSATGCACEAYAPLRKESA